MISPAHLKTASLIYSHFWVSWVEKTVVHTWQCIYYDKILLFCQEKAFCNHAYNLDSLYADNKLFMIGRYKHTVMCQNSLQWGWYLLPVLREKAICLHSDTVVIFFYLRHLLGFVQIWSSDANSKENREILYKKYMRNEPFTRKLLSFH